MNLISQNARICVNNIVDCAVHTRTKFKFFERDMWNRKVSNAYELRQFKALNWLILIGNIF